MFYNYIDVYKATVGNPPDNIRGAKDFEKKAFAKLYKTYGENGLAVLRKLIQSRQLVKLQEDVKKLPQLQKLIDYAPDVEAGLKLATLNTEVDYTKIN